MSLNLANNIIINNINNIGDAIPYFDEIMAVYDLVGNYQNININATEHNNNLSFDIVFKGYDEATKVFTILQRKEVSKYGHIFVPLLTLNFNTLNIKLIDRLN